MTVGVDTVINYSSFWILPGTVNIKRGMQHTADKETRWCRNGGDCDNYNCTFVHPCSKRDCPCNGEMHGTKQDLQAEVALKIERNIEEMIEESVLPDTPAALSASVRDMGSGPFSAPRKSREYQRHGKFLTWSPTLDAIKEDTAEEPCQPQQQPQQQQAQQQPQQQPEAVSRLLQEAKLSFESSDSPPSSRKKPEKQKQLQQQRDRLATHKHKQRLQPPPFVAQAQAYVAPQPFVQNRFAAYQTFVAPHPPQMASTFNGCFQPLYLQSVPPPVALPAFHYANGVAEYYRKYQVAANLNHSFAYNQARVGIATA